MKDFIIDFIFVLVLICVMSLLFGNHKLSKDNLNDSIEKFEQSVVSERVKEGYVDIADNSDNRISKTMSYVSSLCVDIIEFIALVFSNLVSMIL